MDGTSENYMLQEQQNIFNKSRSAERPLLELTSTKISQTFKSQFPLLSMTFTKITIKIRLQST